LEDVMLKMLIAATSLALVASPALAAPCRDSHGKFIKCPKPAGGAIKCRDAKGHFAKCGLPGTHPA
jgi:hypothetical protein